MKVSTAATGPTATIRRYTRPPHRRPSSGTADGGLRKLYSPRENQNVSPRDDGRQLVRSIQARRLQAAATERSTEATRDGGRRLEEEELSYYTYLKEASDEQTVIDAAFKTWTAAQADCAARGTHLVMFQDAGELGLRTLLNGRRMQESSTAQLIHKPADVIAYASAYFTLNPGDLIFTGTPGGVGVFRKPPLFLKDGDEVVVEIDGLGKLTNTVQSTSRPSKRARL